MTRIKKKHIVIILCAVIALLGLFFAAKKIHRAYELRQANVEYPMFDGAVALKRYKGQDYYILKKAFDGEHDIQTTCQDDLRGFDSSSIMSYEEYHNFCEKWQLSEKYHDPNMNYIVFSLSADSCYDAEATLSAVEYNDSKVQLYLWYDFTGVTGDNAGFVCIIPSKQSNASVSCARLNTEAEYDCILRYGEPYDPNDLLLPH